MRVQKLALPKGNRAILNVIKCRTIYLSRLYSVFFIYSILPSMIKKRCTWPSNDLMIEYHDTEWGLPTHDDRILFEFLLLDTFQAGLSWQIILNKRRSFKKAFSNFNPSTISKYNKKKILSLMNDTGIVRNRLKIDSTVTNAKLFIETQREFESFDKYLWGFVNYRPIQNKFKKMSDLPATSKISDEISKDMKKRGFKFVGSTVIYAFIQSAGLVNDHTTNCFRYKEVQ